VRTVAWFDFNSFTLPAEAHSREEADTYQFRAKARGLLIKMIEENKETARPRTSVK
jgi:hypothetical protein